MASLKGPGAAQKHDGSALRIGIVHARWNTSAYPVLPPLNAYHSPYNTNPLFLPIAIIEPLLAGTRAKLLKSGVKEANIVIQSVPGSWELPIACSKCVFPPAESRIKAPPKLTTSLLKTVLRISDPILDDLVPGRRRPPLLVNVRPPIPPVLVLRSVRRHNRYRGSD